jgi:hypothetical protein
MGYKIVPSRVRLQPFHKSEHRLKPIYHHLWDNPRAPLDLAPIPDMKRINTIEEDLMIQIQEGHKLTIQKLQESTAKYKASADKK